MVSVSSMNASIGIAADGPRASSIRSVNDKRVEDRTWAKEVLYPYIRKHGGVVDYDNARADLGKADRSLADVLDKVTKTVLRYESMIDSTRYLVMYDAAPPKTAALVAHFSNEKRSRARRRK